ncbi:hypothetical protein FOZ62_007439, partial [Perkinsus olseni]
EKFTLVPQVLVGLLTGGHGSESSVVSVLRFEWKRASKMFPTGCGTVSLWIAGVAREDANAASLRDNRQVAGQTRDNSVSSASYAAMKQNFCLEKLRQLKEPIPRERTDSCCIVKSKKSSEGKYPGKRESLQVFRQPDDKLSYPRLRRLEGHHRLCDGLRRAHFYRFTSSAERHAQLVTNVIDAQPSTSETHARLLDLRDSLRRETYSASFGMLLMYLLIWRIIKCLAGHPMVAVLSSTWYTARDEIFHFGQLTAEFRLD